MSTNTVTLRSRHAEYRWAGVQFHNHLATVSPAQAERARRDPFFGQGRDFWEDAPADAPAAAGGGKNDPPPPADEPLDKGQLMKLKKDELVTLAAERGLQLDGKENKEQLVEKIIAPEPAAS